MINGKANILPPLGCVAVFAKLVGPLMHQVLYPWGNLAATQHSRSLFDLNEHGVASEPVDEAEKIVNFLVAIKLFILCIGKA